MQITTNQIKLADFLKRNIALILTDFDLNEAKTKQKHFVFIRCTDAKKYTVNEEGKAYEFSFHKITSPEFSKLNLEFQEKIRDTKLNADICFIVADEKFRLTLINYKRE